MPACFIALGGYLLYQSLPAKVSSENGVADRVRGRSEEEGSAGCGGLARCESGGGVGWERGGRGAAHFTHNALGSFAVIKPKAPNAASAPNTNGRAVALPACAVNTWKTPCVIVEGEGDRREWVVSDDGREGGTRRAIDSVQKQATATTFGKVGENATLHRTLKRTGRAKRAEAVADDAIERYLDILGVLSTIFLLKNK